jgi:hypothetical protein
VEAALSTDPDSAELLKLKEDLVQVIELRQDHNVTWSYVMVGKTV